jgi:hypothetical protein
MNDNPNKRYIFIDECGDPNFYGNRKKLLVGTEGFQPLLIIGMIAADNRRALRSSVLQFQESIRNDHLYNTIFSIKSNPEWFLHARADHAEVRAKFFEYLRMLQGFKTYVVIARKSLNIFHGIHHGSPREFYNDVLYHLLKDRLNQQGMRYQLYLSRRDKTTLHQFTQAVESAILRDNTRRKNPIAVDYGCDMVLAQQFPEMSIIDYLLWALQRYILKKEERFFRALSDKYNLIIDLYDRANYKRSDKSRGNYYSSANPFDLEKASPFA